MSERRVLIAGIGNIFMGDDAFGVEVAQRLAQRALPPEVRVVDFGIRGLDLAYALLDGYNLAILVDATPRGGAPGSLYVIEPDPAQPGDSEALPDAHSLTPESVLALVTSLGGQTGVIRIVGCEPAFLGADDDPAMGLSKPVRTAVDEAVNLIEAEVAAFLTADDRLPCCS